MLKSTLLVVLLASACSGSGGSSLSSNGAKAANGKDQKTVETAGASGSGSGSAAGSGGSEVAVEGAVSSVDISGAYLTCARDPSADAEMSGGDAAVGCGTLDAGKTKRADVGLKINPAHVHYGDAAPVDAAQEEPKDAGAKWQVYVGVSSLRLADLAIELETSGANSPGKSVIKVDMPPVPAGAPQYKATTISLSDPDLKKINANCEGLAKAEFDLQAQSICTLACKRQQPTSVGRYLSCASETLSCGCMNGSTATETHGSVDAAGVVASAGDRCTDAIENTDIASYAFLRSYCQLGAGCGGGPHVGWPSQCANDGMVCSCVSGELGGSFAGGDVDLTDLKSVYENAPTDCNDAKKGQGERDLDLACNAFCAKGQFKAGWAAACNKGKATCSCVR
jgi:hypothetical protein